MTLWVRQFQNFALPIILILFFNQTFFLHFSCDCPKETVLQKVSSFKLSILKNIEVFVNMGPYESVFFFQNATLPTIVSLFQQ